MPLLQDDPPQVVADPPRRTPPRQSPSSPGHPPRRRPPAGLGLLAALLAVVAAVVVLAPGLPDLNPFEREARDRSQPVLLRSLNRISEYRAASANLQVVVDLEEDVSVLPSFLAGERTLLVAAGTADAAVDFGRIDAGALEVSDDRRSVRLRLPRARMTQVRLDLERTRVFDRERGLLDRVGGVFGQDPDEDRRLLLAAERKLAEAARADGALVAAGERNTREMLERLLRGLGFQRVDVAFG
jgi:hypothetical protein